MFCNKHRKWLYSLSTRRVSRAGAGNGKPVTACDDLSETPPNRTGHAHGGGESGGSRESVRSAEWICGGEDRLRRGNEAVSGLSELSAVDAGRGTPPRYRSRIG